MSAQIEFYEKEVKKWGKFVRESQDGDQRWNYHHEKGGLSWKIGFNFKNSTKQISNV